MSSLLPAQCKRIRTNLFGGTLEMTEEGDKQEGLHIPYARRWPIVNHRIGHLKAFQSEAVQDPNSFKQQLAVEESYMFEYCDGCDLATCAGCMPKCGEIGLDPVEFFFRPTASLWTLCRAGCGRVFCNVCIENPAIILKCQACNRIHFGVPDGMEGTWCDSPKCCKGPGFQGKLVGLVGPWEEKEMVPSFEAINEAMDKTGWSDVDFYKVLGLPEEFNQ
jgi:hypothetical protein